MRKSSLKGAPERPIVYRSEDPKHAPGFVVPDGLDLDLILDPGLARDLGWVTKVGTGSPTESGSAAS